MSLKCYVHKSLLRAETYLFTLEKEDFSSLPEGLLEAMGEMQMFLELELTPEKRLQRADAAEVMRQLTEKGYYLQMPPSDHISLE